MKNVILTLTALLTVSICSMAYANEPSRTPHCMMQSEGVNVQGIEEFSVTVNPFGTDEYTVLKVGNFVDALNTGLIRGPNRVCASLTFSSLPKNTMLTPWLVAKAVPGTVGQFGIYHSNRVNPLVSGSKAEILAIIQKINSTPSDFAGQGLSNEIPE